ncbi:MAG TPA: glycoside hydrolase family 3 N-terminal domain-containing protein, partial [Chroococcales cyanobacterium]
ELLADVTTLGAKQLKALGFNCLLAPVLDVLTNPLNPVIATRALGDTPQKVSQLGSVMIKAIADAGIVAVGKHFPGHGSTSEDSHTDLAVNKADCESVWRTDLVPFRNCINELPAILTAHVWLSSVDQEPLPASLSPRITRGILRDYLGFQGLVMTDDMIMKAITSQYGLKEAVAMALEAGNDLLLVCSTIEETLAVHEYLVGEVTSGRLSEELINAALERTEKLFSQAPQVIPESKIEEFKKKLERDTKRSMLASVRAIAMLRGELPESRSGEWLVLVPRHPRYPLNITEHLNAQIKALKIKDLKFTEIRYPLDPTSENIWELAAKTVERQVIYVTYRSLLNRGQEELGKAIAADARQAIAVHAEVPFDILLLPDFENCLCTFDPSEQAMKALALVLLGEVEPAGTCPTNLQFILQTAP